MNTMMTVKNTRIAHLKDDTTVLRDVSLQYELNSVKVCGRRCYAITVANGREHSTCCFGSDRREAIEIYRTIVENNVTPCSLRDIAEDFAKSRRRKRS